MPLLGRGGRRCAVALALAALPACMMLGGGMGRGMGGGGSKMHPGMAAMMAGVLPEPALPLPDPESEGARLVAAYCAQCHATPAPVMKTAAEWPAVVARMAGRMRSLAGLPDSGFGEVGAPTKAEEAAILSYLAAHALRPASSATLAWVAPGRSAYLATCSQCHAPPDPALHTVAEWPAVVARMRANEETMGRRQPTREEEEAILAYLVALAAPEG